MNFYSLGFVLVILAASGVIAYVADWLGKKLGKKRLSVRSRYVNLRPKHVASLGTVGMGVLVSAITIGLVAASSQDARTWLQRGQELVDDLHSLERKNARAQEENERLSREGGGLRRTNADLGRTNVGLKAAVTRLKGELAREQASLDRERVALATLKTERTNLLAERGRLNGQVASLKGQVDAVRRQYEKTNGLLAQAETKLAGANAALLRAQTDLRTTRLNAKVYHSDANEAKKTSLETYKKNQALLAEVEERKALVEKLQKETAGLVKDRDDAEASLVAAQADYTEIQRRLAQAGQDLRDLEEIAQGQQLFLARTTRTSRTEALTYGRGEEVARTEVAPASDSTAAAAALATLLRNARIAAAARGAKENHVGGATFEAADIADRQDPKTGNVVDAATLKRAFAAAVAGRPQEQVIVATSTLNAFAGEPVSLDLKVLPNPLVYRRDEVVSETTIDGAQTEDRILDQLREFVGGRVHDRAIQDRMIPRAGTPAPFGEIATGDWLAAVQSVKRAGRSVRVQALAGGDTRAADPLRLEFHVK